MISVHATIHALCMNRAGARRMAAATYAAATRTLHTMYSPLAFKGLVNSMKTSPLSEVVRLRGRGYESHAAPGDSPSTRFIPLN